MSTETILQLIFNIFLTAVGVTAILHERELILFERKAKKYIKAFIKAVYYTITRKEVE